MRKALTINRTEEIQNLIGCYIHENQLQLGDSLPSEGDLVTLFKASRVTVREALKGLAALGIITIGNGRRPQVARVENAVLQQIMEHVVYINQASIQQIYDVRKTIEIRTAFLAANHRDAAMARKIESTAQEMRLARTDKQRGMQLDLQFHQLIAQASGNTVMELILSGFDLVTETTWPIAWESRHFSSHQNELFDIHEEIARAIKMKEPEAAEAAMLAHFDNSIANLQKAGLI